MKLALSVLALATGASAFAPNSYRTAVPNVALQMSEEPEAAVEEAEAEEAPAAPAPAPAKPAAPAKIIGNIAPLGEAVGKYEWELLTTKWGTAETGTFLRAAELKHGRSAMLATVGFAFHKLGLTLNNISPHEYLSVTQNIKFADLAAMTPLDAMKSLPAESWGQMFAAIALVEIYELTHKDGKLAYDETVAPGLQPGGLTGNLGWNPLRMTVDERRQLVELQNGRAAMFAISAWVAHDAIPGSVPLFLPWN
mmetsp:Transcript_59751/g.146645  ORF Transcript_59751/g.146645 Transcript_59751/m.146645 type:complete len:252 (+) Transcript_59751:80-835(+)|eukprot:CAMPEP_0113471896 /NCGR_PEP_ID=MMETSP0014_2-20120614/17221_1 /TAXON_ID=2857 /ORGANISM="Nitzschia sp." /LENGTH=251 /DNA_ID=CAMNT_0000364559 /DNA_START=57 /DNA_END=812 /DNA_ORIENTATION=+ /assembly_acc=CAM_ASM_000159